ncbi:PLP-dependent aminotransferase family protein, partial [Rhizobium johnstonii]
ALDREGIACHDADAGRAGMAPEAVRVCLGGPITREKMQGALEFMAHALEGQPEMAASFF